MPENPYLPTPHEVEVTLGRSKELKLSGDGIFATLQGEGITAGKPSVFLRLQNCNLHCGKGGEGWLCDTWYTWDRSTREFWQETRLESVEQVADDLKGAWSKSFGTGKNVPNLVVTGGEPLLQQQKIVNLLSLLPGWDIEIETNGTFIPSDELKKAQINCSPKLSSSGNSLRSRRKKDVLERIATFPNYWFKFVIASEEDLAEVDEIMQVVNNGDYSRVLLMSEGSDPERLIEQDNWLWPIAQQLGCMITRRNHIFWFGDKRAT